MKPAEFATINGESVETSHVIDNYHQGLNYGACIYEGIRFYDTKEGPAIFRLDDHLDRFFYSASVLKMTLPFSKDDLKRQMIELVQKNGLPSGYLRPLAYYSEPKMGINILGAKISTMILSWPWDESRQTKSVDMMITKYRRVSPEAIDFKAKITGYYANNLLGFLDAREHGFSEPLFLDGQGFIAEGAVNNIFVVKGEKIYTPTTRNVLAGITRDSIIQIAKDLNIEVIEKDLLPEELTGADGVFLSGTGIELEVVHKIDGYFENNQVPEVISRLKESFRRVAKGEDAKYSSWLTIC